MIETPYLRCIDCRRKFYNWTNVFLASNEVRCDWCQDSMNEFWAGK